MVSIWKTFRSMRDGRCRESGRSLEARCREVSLYKKCIATMYSYSFSMKCEYTCTHEDTDHAKHLDTLYTPSPGPAETLRLLGGPVARVKLRNGVLIIPVIAVGRAARLIQTNANAHASCPRLVGCIQQRWLSPNCLLQRA